MDLQEIDVFIEQDGTVRIEVRGVKGVGCLAVTRALEDALGGVVEQREMTPEAAVAVNETLSEEDRLRQGRSE